MMAKLHDLRMKVSTPSKARESLEGKYESRITSKIDSHIESKTSSNQKPYEPIKSRTSESQRIDPVIMERLNNLEALVLGVKSQLESRSPKKTKSRRTDSRLKEIGMNMDKLQGICEQIAGQEEMQIEAVVIRNSNSGFQSDSVVRRVERKFNDS